MSRICICVMKISKDKYAYIENDIKKQLKSIGLHYVNTIEYLEPFLLNLNQNEFSYFSISNSYMDNTCEMFFLPDNWLFNGQKNDVLFIVRMKQLEKILGYILKFISEIELYLGNSGTELIDYVTIEIEVSKFANSVNTHFNFCDSELPDVCYKIR